MCIQLNTVNPRTHLCVVPVSSAGKGQRVATWAHEKGNGPLDAVVSVTDEPRTFCFLFPLLLHSLLPHTHTSTHSRTVEAPQRAFAPPPSPSTSPSLPPPLQAREMAHVIPKALHKRIKGTNVEVRKEVTDDNTDAQSALLYSIHADDETELRWLHNTLRPERNLVHPSDAFLRGIKTLHPAAIFNTFDVKKAKLRRLTKHERDKATAMKRRKEEVAPTAAYKAAVNPHKTPRTGGAAPADEVRVLSRGMNKSQKARSRRRAAHKSGKVAEAPKTFFTKWKKRKQEKIGRGL
ncbi:conserved hypothetical protein [Leishmania braziliensis MHOM/BR/75/M2904]|uniref:Uncharacterized protein n=5 Tax=Viannia TaxID=37616 RepID=A4H3V5_LEIBR|nr:conserved hypothetical protein [Leishmania braziliensis MHOM/BR/75/M2904]CAM41516.1 conserved hypothetical protein [Leishmania braziliensis MHOM/BR/75/M2904]